MTNPETVLVAQRTEADERATLEAFLDMMRADVAGRLRGVGEQDARRSTVPSGTSLGGLIRHLTWVEIEWFEQVLGRTPADQLPPSPCTDEDPDADFRLEDEHTVDGVLDAYRQQCARSRDILAKFDLGDTVPHGHLGTVSARWVLIHMIEETARHAGHADIIREQIDGVSGRG
jgi:hypothetical protein